MLFNWQAVFVFILWQVDIRFYTYLKPVLFRTDSTLFPTGSAVYTPADGDNWMMAKLNVQVTDIGYAQLVEHLDKVLSTALPDVVVLAVFHN